MRIFDHPNMRMFKCPICGTKDDKKVVLIGIEGTQDDDIIQCEQFHLECIELRYVEAGTKHKAAIFMLFEEKQCQPENDASEK